MTDEDLWDKVNSPAFLSNEEHQDVMTLKKSLPSFSPYTFGTMSLGRAVASFDKDIAVARTAMDAGVWFHTSQEYSGGGSFMPDDLQRALESGSIYYVFTIVMTPFNSNRFRGRRANGFHRFLINPLNKRHKEMADDGH